MPQVMVTTTVVTAYMVEAVEAVLTFQQEQLAWAELVCLAVAAQMALLAVWPVRLAQHRQADQAVQKVAVLVRAVQVEYSSHIGKNKLQID
jgi:predicted carbohydrate-binding protein with CBM5 and CBM33 domain